MTTKPSVAEAVPPTPVAPRRAGAMALAIQTVTAGEGSPERSGGGAVAMMALATVCMVYNNVQNFYIITLLLSALPVHHERAGDAKQPQRRPGLQMCQLQYYTVPNSGFQMYYPFEVTWSNAAPPYLRRSSASPRQVSHQTRNLSWHTLAPHPLPRSKPLIALRSQPFRQCPGWLGRSGGSAARMQDSGLTGIS
eukprot:COSAG02_NODE_8317_length_2618_cov_317.236602_4_plen_194_part_01